VFWIIVAAVIALDRISKLLVVKNMQLGQFIELGKTGMGLRYVRNTGAAFSFFVGRTSFLLIFTALLMSAILFYYIKYRGSMSRAEHIFLAMILGGGLGNFLDRLIYGYVVDFLDIRILPIFNVADICITCGCLLLILVVLYFDKGKAA
jgi:signal peptidase II